MLAPDRFSIILQSILLKAKKHFPESTPEQTSWDSLTRLEENIKAFDSAKLEFLNAQITSSRADVLE
jgi:hypothetical protein